MVVVLLVAFVGCDYPGNGGGYPGAPEPDGSRASSNPMQPILRCASADNSDEVLVWRSGDEKDTNLYLRVTHQTNPDLIEYPVNNRVVYKSETDQEVVYSDASLELAVHKTQPQGNGFAAHLSTSKEPILDLSLTCAEE